MAHGLLIRNANGDTVLDTTSNILNFETVSVTQVTLASGASTNVTVEDVHVPEAVIFDLDGTGVEDVATTTSTNTLTLQNNGGASRTVDLSFFRLL